MSSPHPENRPCMELLAPAGGFDRLETALHYGADAVYLSGRDFSLRRFAANFGPDELDRAVRLAHGLGRRVYVAVNLYSRNAEQEAIDDWLRVLAEIGPDALIVADPAVFQAARSLAPGIPIHVSTQANVTNWRAARFWKDLGAARIIAARELTLEEIAEIRRRADIPVEVFVHGAMCISYSGRCLLSAALAGRDGNRGLCCQPCRFRYAVMEETRPGQYFPIAQDERGAYIFNSRDLNMVGHLPALAAAGVSGLKIEGRSKGLHYVGSVTRAYRAALDAWTADPEGYEVRPEWSRDLDLTGHRGFCAGFYFGNPADTAPNPERCEFRSQDAEALFAGQIREASAPGRFRVDVRNRLREGDGLEILPARGPSIFTTVRDLRDDAGASILQAQPNAIADLPLPAGCGPLDLIRITRER